MRTPVLIVHICSVLLPVVCGRWYDAVLASGDTCEDLYPYESCLDSPQCVYLFMECECVPRKMKYMLNGDPEDGHTLCLLADVIMQLGAPTCCEAQKRAMLRSFEQRMLPSGNVLEGNPSSVGTTTDTHSTSATSAKKRTSELASKRRDLKNTVNLLLNRITKINDSKTKLRTRSAQPHKDDILIQTLYDYLQHVTKTSEPLTSITLKKRRNRK